MRNGWLLLLVAAGACAPADDDSGDSDSDVPAEEPMVMLASRVGFIASTGSTSEGFDLDGRVSDGSAAADCGKSDLVAPDGTEGIDNAFGGLLPLIASLGGAALPDLVQNSVLSGELLILVEMSRYATAVPGECFPARVVRGAGLPALGTDGVILPYQTFEIDPEQDVSELPCMELQDDGSFVADGLSLRLKMNVFDESIDLTAADGRIRIEPTDDGAWKGLIGGAVSVAEITTNVLGFDAIPESLEQGVVSAVELNADLAPDPNGVCTQVSVTLDFDAVPAFLFAEEPATE